MSILTLYFYATQYTMSNTYLDMAIEAVPKFEKLLFTKKLCLAQYADSTIYSYRLKISQEYIKRQKLFSLLQELWHRHAHHTRDTHYYRYA